jgi:membrane peptidoglycan carboxypeptidase
MALGNREQVGSSFKPYVLATARHQGMSVKTSILDGTSPLCVPGDQYPQQFSVPATGPGQTGCPSTPYGWHAFSNDAGDTGSGGPQSVVYATAQSLNTAFTDLAHRVGLQNVTNMAKAFGVDTSSYSNGGSGLQDQASAGEVGIALGTASLTVAEQANTFAVLAANGQYATPHVIKQITLGTNLIAAKVTRRMALTPAEASDVNYPLSYDTINGTGTRAAMSDGRPIIGKTGTTETAESAFFLGAIPQYSLAVGMFTNQQNSIANGQTLNGVGGLPGYGGYWPALIWHSFAEKVFAKLPVQSFAQPAFGGTTWNLVGPGQTPAKPHPHPHPTITKPPHPTPTGTCTPVPLGPPCDSSPPPTSPPPTSPSPTPSCTPAPGKPCRTRPPNPSPFGSPNSGSSTSGSGTSGSKPRPVATATTRSPRLDGGG